MRETCVTCSGRGSRRRSSFSTAGATIESTCPDCKGTGYVLPPAEDLAANLDAALKRAETLDKARLSEERLKFEALAELDEARAALAELDEARAALVSGRALRDDLRRERDEALKRAEALAGDHTLAIQRLGEVTRERDAALVRVKDLEAWWRTTSGPADLTAARDAALRRAEIAEGRVMVAEAEADEARAALAKCQAASWYDAAQAAHATMRRVGADTLAALDELARLVPKAHITPRTHRVLAKLRALAAELTKDL